MSICFCGGVYAADGDVIYVNNASGLDSNDGFTPATAKLTIANATGTVNNNGVVNIADGTYTGTGNTGITISRNMSITGQSQTGTIIDAENNDWIFEIEDGLTVAISKLTLKNSETSDDSYGAIYSTASTLTISNCSFISNIASDDGGAIYSEDGKLTVTNCYFEDNYADGDGGAIYSSYEDCVISDSTFIDNYADDEGGAIYVYGKDCIISDSTFIDNYAGDGGAVYADCNLTCNNCDFKNNTADDEAGAIFNDDLMTCTGCTFKDNTAAYYGGVIHSEELSTFIDCDFINNNAGSDGGAIYNCCGDTNVTNCTFENNTAAYDGGALYNDDDLVTVTDCTFKGNHATEGDGGALYNNGNEMIVIGSTLINNTALDEGGAFYNDGADFTLNFNRIVGNIAESGNDIYDDNSYSEDHDALYNWWGSNDGPADDRIVGELVEYDPWLIMRYSAESLVITQGSTSTLTADFRYDSNNTYHDPALGHLPDGTPVTFTTTLGNVGSKSVTKYTLNGIATAILRGDEAAGEALTSAILDRQTLYSTITINAATVNAATGTQVTAKTVGMQTTGAPIAPLALAIFSVLGGLAATRKKQ